MTDQEDPERLYALGTSYMLGAGRPKDPGAGAVCLRQAADRGSLAAKRDLGIAYLNGLGVERDPGKAYPLIKEASDSADPNAMYRLALMYEAGEGVPQDLYEALKLMAFAVGSGLSGASEDADRIEAEIDSRREARLRARPLLNLEVSDVDVEAACCGGMMGAVLSGSCFVEDTYKGPMLIFCGDSGGEPITECPFCGKRARRVERGKKYRPSQPRSDP